MGQKVNPIGFRLGVNRDWRSRWYASAQELPDFLHSDLEIPCSCCIIFAGIRGEYGYVWSDVLQRQNNSDIQTINLLFTLGTRF